VINQDSAKKNAPNGPLVSVIMNAFNAEEFVREALESALKQTYPNLEIIFWDNCSTDITASIVQEYNDPRIQYFLGQRFTSLGEARNLALEKAQGEFLAFLDCDDVWMPDKIAQQIGLFEDPGVGLVYSDSVFFNNSNKTTNCFANRRPYRGFVFEEILLNYVLSMETVIVRKAAIESMSHLFDPRFTAIEEYEFFARVAQKWKVDYSPLLLSKWRVHAKSWTWQKQRSFVDEKKMMLADLKNNLELNQKYANSLNTFSDQIEFENAKQFWIEGNGRESRVQLKKVSIWGKRTWLLWIASIFPHRLIDRLYAFTFKAIRPD
jgi:glycosyltransferase involved in cell wall biosynthesis